MLKDFVEYIAKGLVDEPEQVQVTEQRHGERVNLHLQVASGDMGKVIGKNGRIATALRQMLKVAAVREDVRASLEIGD